MENQIKEDFIDWYEPQLHDGKIPCAVDILSKIEELSGISPTVKPTAVTLRIFEGRRNIAAYLNDHRIYGLEVGENDKEIFFGVVKTNEITKALKS